jgi:hypothetical protein
MAILNTGEIDNSDTDWKGYDMGNDTPASKLDYDVGNEHRLIASTWVKHCKNLPLY